MKTFLANFKCLRGRRNRWPKRFSATCAGLVLGLTCLSSAVQAQVLFSDNFTRGTDPGPITPWNAQSGNWTVTGGRMVGGINSQQSYGFAYITNTSADYYVQAQIQFSATNTWGGGVGGRLDPVSGAHYAAWVYPEGSPPGGNVVRLIKFQTWTSFGYQGTSFAFMAVTNLNGVGTNLHTLKLGFLGNQITVAYDGTNVITTTDAEAQPYTNGAVSLDFWTDLVTYNYNVDNVTMVAQSLALVANNDNYNVVLGRTLSVPAPGVLGNDSGGSGPLSAILVASPTHGTFSFNTNGGFNYTPTNNFIGNDTFTYRATDTHSNSPVATVTIAVTADHPPVANNDSYTGLANNALAVAAPGVLANDTDVDGDSLTAALVAGTTNGTLSLSNNGSFTYTPAANFSGTDAFTYRANDGVSNSATATATLSVLPATTLFFDDFRRGTDPGPLSPWIAQSGNWTVTGGTLSSGINPLTSYAFAYLTNIWTNYSVQARIQFTSTNAYGGGVGGCLNPATGAHYAAWVFPDGSPAGGNVLQLFKFQTWTTFGYNGTPGAPMQTVNLPGVGTTNHTVKLAFFGSRIAVYYDGAQVMSVTDIEAQPYFSGGVSADMWTDQVTYNLSVDDVIVSPLVNDGFYNVNENTILNVGAPGVLGNDSEVFGTNLTASLVSGTSNGTLNLNSDGSFTYNPNTGYLGADSFVYSANDGPTNLGSATVYLAVSFLGPSVVYSEKFDGVTAPALPAGWTTSATGVESNWVTQTTVVDTASNAVFCPDVANVGQSDLVSPVINLPVGEARLSFRNNYTFETGVGTNGFDGGALDIKIGAGAFTDIIAAGGSFVSGGYNAVINNTFFNPIGGRLAWSGSSGGFITTVVNLPGSASGQSIQLRWRCGTDNGNGAAGWRVDTIAISNCPTFGCWNTAPVFGAQPTNTVNELTLLTVTNAATDQDIPPNGLSYRLSSPPAGAAINTNTGVITWTPSQAQSHSTNIISTIVTDNGSPPMSRTNGITVIVREVNVAPVLPPQSDRTNAGLTTLIVTNTATESNINSATFGYGLVAPPAGATINSNGIINWTPNPLQVPGTYTFTTIFTNNNPFDPVNPQLKATNSFDVTVNLVHNGPILPNLANRTNNELVQLTVTNTAIDIDVPVLTLTYSLVSPLAGMNISTNGIFTWTPDQTQSPSTNTITTVVTDNGLPNLSATNSFTVVVREINTAPILPAQSNLTVNELTLVTVTNTATESNIHATIFGYGLVNPPLGASINSNGIITWSPPQSLSPSTNTITTVVTNNDPFDLINPQLKATNSFTVVVKEVNVAPVLPTQTNFTVDELTLMTITNTATESNIHATIIGYGLVNPPTGASISSNGIITWTPPQALSPSTNTITTVVTNSDPFDLVNPQLTAINSFTVVVREVNTAPVLPVQSNVTILGLGSLTVTNTATESNIHATITGYALVSAPTGMLMDTNGIITWTPLPGQVPSTNQVTTVVTNNDPFDLINPSLTATNSFTVTVNAIHNGPGLPVQTNLTVNELTLMTVTNTAFDTDIPSLTLTYSLVSPPTGANIDTNGVITWTPPQTLSPSTNVITTVVTDNGAPNLSATNSFTVVVNEVNIAPVLPAQSNVTIVGLASLVVTNAATESNIHATITGYALTAAPTGMLVDSNGIITWTPTTNQVPGTNLVTTVVTNNDPFDLVNPQLTATNSFTVTVTAIHNGPGLPAQSNLTVDNLSLLIVTNTAIDTDIPALTLTYSLVSPPAGLVISSNGIITWTPSLLADPATNVVTTVVSDNGVPVLSATNSFTVVIRSTDTSPVIQSITLSNTNVVLTWTSIVDRSYRVQYNDDLTTTNWNDLAPDILAAGTLSSATNSVGGGPQRFYRIRLLLP